MLDKIFHVLIVASIAFRKKFVPSLPSVIRGNMFSVCFPRIFFSSPAISRPLTSCFLLACMLMTFASPCLATSASVEIPQSLQGWKSWVLHNTDEEFCPTEYNNDSVHICVWPSMIKLSIDAKGGNFEQKLLVFAKKWVALPGGGDIWPDKIISNGKKIPVIKRNKIPCIHLFPGEYIIKGRFEWTDMPEMINIPPYAGMVNLFIKGAKIDFPLIDKKNRLWLQKRSETTSSQEKLEVHIFRLIHDDIPMKITNLVKINVSGPTREINLENILLENSIPIGVRTPLPARILPNGGLSIHARPGQWEVMITTRFIDPVDELGPVLCAYGREIWSFEAKNRLRMVKITSVPSVEPGRTDLPQKWKRYPAYIIKPDSRMIFQVIRRGDPDPAPDMLNIERTWWLDFNGKGFTINDRITGTMNSQWYLAMSPPGVLGRVAVDGRDLLITACGKDAKPGVELRRGSLNLTADSRLAEPVQYIPTVSWDHNFQKFSGTLNLPPGWRLFYAGGVDIMPRAWLQKWTLLDFFIVLIISITVFKLKKYRWGLVALAAMALIYHEQGSPRLIWLSVLAAIALLQVLPSKGRAKKLAGIWYFGSIITLIIISIPFMVQQIRYGMYPQLERLGRHPAPFTVNDFLGEKSLMLDEQTDGTLKKKSLVQSYYNKGMQRSEQERASMHRGKVLTYDPDALIQTGPGLPEWKWRSFTMKINGPVDEDSRISLRLISPAVNLILSFVRIILLVLFIIGITNYRSLKQIVPIKKNNKSVPCMLIFLLSVLSFSNAEGSGYPPPELLHELREILTEKPDCFPWCADCTEMELDVKHDNLKIRLSVNAYCKTAIPLPVTSRSWNPEEVLLDGEPIKGLVKNEDGMLWALIPKGIHTIVINGKTGTKNLLRIPLPLPPNKAKVVAIGWEVQGVDQNGKVEASIQLNRLKKRGQNTSHEKEMELLPFLHVKRVIHLGLTWKVTTSVRRITRKGIPIVVSLPLIEGESVTTAGIQVKNSMAIIKLGPKTTDVQFESYLKISNNIKLEAPRSDLWTETWILDASPVWHCTYLGIPVIFHQNQQGYRRPEWRPWPGEQVSIAISRPEAIVGQVVTIDRAKLELTPGKRFTKTGLHLKIRASQGRQHQIILPDNAILQSVKIDNKIQPIRQEGNKVIMPLRPGCQNILCEWQEMKSSYPLLKTPEVTIGNEAVNASVVIKMPRNRWILWVAGPRIGPAVLFWSLCFAVLVISFALGRIKITPLKTYQWFLLGLGLTQLPIFVSVIIVCWFIALGLRGEKPPGENWFYFNITQLFLTVLTIAALSGLYAAIKKGLLGIPDMQVAGNYSSNTFLIWTEDRVGSLMPMPSVISLPLFVYHLLMLFWSLWLAFSLVKWLRWGWDCFGEGGIWKKISFKKKQKSKSCQD